MPQVRLFSANILFKTLKEGQATQTRETLKKSTLLMTSRFTLIIQVFWRQLVQMENIHSGTRQAQKALKIVKSSSGQSNKDSRRAEYEYKQRPEEVNFLLFNWSWRQNLRLQVRTIQNALLTSFKALVTTGTEDMRATIQIRNHRSSFEMSWTSSSLKGLVYKKLLKYNFFWR